MAAATKRGRGRPRVEPILVFKAQSFIQGHFTQELSLRETAKAVNINPNYLSEKFKEVTGVNFVEYVARIRFANACDLVRNSKLSISEIAFAAGFQSLSQFNRVFKRFSGKSPRQYRAATVDALVA
jgi:AraC-like DNA-binding protein